MHFDIKVVTHTSEALQVLHGGLYIVYLELYQIFFSVQIAAGQLSSDMDQSQSDQIYRKMYYKNPEITLLYVTPEKVLSDRQSL